MNIVVLDAYTANSGDLSWEELDALGTCTIYPRTAPHQVVQHAAQAEVLLTNKVVIDDTHLAALPCLKYIGVLATGYNVVDLAAATRRGIVVTNIPAYSTPSVGQMVFAHLLNIAQQVKHHADLVRAGCWTESPDFCFRDTPLIELQGKKIGLIGLGETGSSAARIAIGFGMKVQAYTSKSTMQLPPEIKKVALDQLFAHSDVVSLHCPLTDDTRHIVNARRLALMKPTAILINTGRGALIDEPELARALNNNHIYAAGLDVLSTEPPLPANPLLTAKNCYITPHLAWATTEARKRLIKTATRNVEAYAKGKPINVVK